MILVGAVAGTLGGPWLSMAFGDDLLRPSYGELSARERDALNELVKDLRASDPDVRYGAIGKLGAVGRSAIPALREEAVNESDPKRVSMACLALAAIGEPSCFAILRSSLLEGSAHEDTLRAALIGLSLQGRATGNALDPETSQAIRELMLGRSLDTVTQVATLVASQFQLANLSVDLRRRIQSERNPMVRATYLLAIGRHRSPSATPVVAEELKKNRNQTVRRAALYAAAQLRDPAFVTELLRFRPDDDELQETCLALGAFADQAVVERLESMLDKHRERASMAIYSLANIGSNEALGVLERVLQGEYGSAVLDVGCLAVAGLREPQRFVASLSELAFHRDPDIQFAALLTLARLDETDVVENLLPNIPRMQHANVQRAALLVCRDQVGQELCDSRFAGTDAERAATAVLCQTLMAIRAGKADARLAQEQIRAMLQQELAHYDLHVDEALVGLVYHVMDLNRIRFNSYEDRGQAGGGSDGDDGGGEPGGGEGDAGGGIFSRGGILQPRSRRNDNIEFEEDMRRFLADFPLFPASAPFSAP